MIMQLVDYVVVKGKNVIFKQCYWVNLSYWRKFDGLVFLYIGGEFEMFGDFIDYGQLLNFLSFYLFFCEFFCILGCKQVIFLCVGVFLKVICSFFFVYY